MTKIYIIFLIELDVKQVTGFIVLL